ncbi:MAG TPA: hypothetical protein IAA71_09890 [Candidatus Pullichristensenella stercoripullorum]|nr:hypothetical protein [Candidatus Pullichristensenella stercoripullorum]
MACEHPLDFGTLLRRMLTFRDERVVTCPACGQKVRVEFDRGMGRWLSGPIPAIPLIICLFFILRMAPEGGWTSLPNLLRGLGLIAAGFAAMLLIWLPCCLIIQRCRLYRVIPVSEP